MITAEELENSYKEGLIPSEDENEIGFLARRDYCLNIKKSLIEHLGSEAPPLTESTSSLFRSAKEVYGISPLWTPVAYTNEKLLPWQGAAAWIFELTKGAPLSAMIQIRTKTWSFFGSKDEIMTHEVSHIGRMAYQEKGYEEFLAYQSSPSRFRRYFGPLFRSSFESIFFMSLLILVVMFDFALLMSGSIAWYDRFMIFKLVPAIYLLYFVLRLVLQHQTFQKTLKKVGDFKVVYLLLDCEIEAFSKKKVAREDIEKYFEEGKEKSLRRQLVAQIWKR